MPSKEYRDAEAQEAKAKRRQRKEEEEKEAKVSNIILLSSLMGPFLFGKFISTSLQAVIEAEEKRQLPPLPYPCTALPYLGLRWSCGGSVVGRR